MYKPNTVWTWSFLIISILQALIALALEAYVFPLGRMNQRAVSAWVFALRSMKHKN